jgi:hypothetical protein
MGLRGSVQQMRENFEAQFEAAGGDRYLYRRGQKGEPIPVSAEERTQFIKQYIRAVWSILFGMMGVLAVFWGLIFWWMVEKDRDLPAPVTYGGTGAILIVAIACMYWVRAEPARQLEGRTPVGRERTKDEMRAIYLSKTTYAQVGAAAAFGVFLILVRSRAESQTEHLIWLGAGVFLLLFAAIQAFRKWRFDQEG